MRKINNFLTVVLILSSTKTLFAIGMDDFLLPREIDYASAPNPGPKTKGISSTSPSDTKPDAETRAAMAQLGLNEFNTTIGKLTPAQATCFKRIQAKEAFLINSKSSRLQQAVAYRMQTNGLVDIVRNNPGPYIRDPGTYLSMLVQNVTDTVQKKFEWDTFDYQKWHLGDGKGDNPSDASRRYSDSLRILLRNASASHIPDLMAKVRDVTGIKPQQLLLEYEKSESYRERVALEKSVACEPVMSTDNANPKGLTPAQATGAIQEVTQGSKAGTLTE